MFENYKNLNIRDREDNVYNLCIVDIADPHQGFLRLLQLPSEVLYLKLAGGHRGVPLLGHCRCNLVVGPLRERGNSLDISGNLKYTRRINKNYLQNYKKSETKEKHRYFLTNIVAPSRTA